MKRREAGNQVIAFLQSPILSTPCCLIQLSTINEWTSQGGYIIMSDCTILFHHSNSRSSLPLDRIDPFSQQLELKTCKDSK